MEDLRVTIEGKVREKEKDIASIQAIVKVFLMDEEGFFL